MLGREQTQPETIWNKRHAFIMSEDELGSMFIVEQKHVCPCSTCLERHEDVVKLKNDLHSAQHESAELKLYIRHVEDLNMISPYITRYYTEIFRQIKREFKQNHTDSLSSFPYTSWIELFSAVSSEVAQFDEFVRDKKPLNDKIIEIMGKLGGLGPQQWDHLQEIRKDRNEKGHPRLDDDKVIMAIKERWSDHPASEALQKMMSFLEKLKNRKRPVDRRRKMFNINNKRSW